MMKLVALGFGILTHVVTTQTILEKFSLDSYPDAVCNDGTSAAYYFRPGSGVGSNNWLIQLEGGGACISKFNCDQRLPIFTSSQFLTDTVESFGLFEASDPRLANANLVFVPFCTSDVWIGETTLEESGDVQKHFRGRAVIDAVLDDLMATKGLGESEARHANVLFTGCSAGGIGVALNLDYVTQRLQTKGIRNVTGHIDSGVIFEYDTFPGRDQLTDFLPQGFDLWNARRNLDRRCLRRNRREPWKCLDTSIALQFTKNRRLSISEWQVDSAFFNTYARSPDLVIDSPEEIESALSYAETAIEKFEKVFEVRRREQRPTIFAPNCNSHCFIITPVFHTISVNGVTLEQVILDKMFGPSRGELLIEECDGFACGVCEGVEPIQTPPPGFGFENILPADEDTFP